MRFSTWTDPDSGRDVVMAFIDALPAKTRGMLLTKLDGWRDLAFVELRQAEILLKVQGTKKAFELRVRVNSRTIRLYGIVKGETMHLIHALDKKTRKIPQRDLRQIHERSERAWRMS